MDIVHLAAHCHWVRLTFTLDSMQKRSTYFESPNGTVVEVKDGFSWAAFFFGYANSDNQRRMFVYAGLIIIGSGFFDLVDGEVARAQNRVTRFGAFFDSVVDRYSDASQFFGLLVFYARAGRFFYIVLTAYVIVSAIMVSYSRARAESLIGSCRVGFMERPERLVLVIIGALFNRMAPVLWVIAVLSTITVIHRIQYTWARTNGPEALKSGDVAA